MEPKMKDANEGMEEVSFSPTNHSQPELLPTRQQIVPPHKVSLTWKEQVYWQEVTQARNNL